MVCKGNINKIMPIDEKEKQKEKITIVSEKGWIHTEKGWKHWYAIIGLPEQIKIKKIITEDNQTFDVDHSY